MDTEERLVDPDNSHLLARIQDSVLVTPRVLSHLLAHVALRPELNVVFDELFGSSGTDIAIIPSQELDLGNEPVTFHQIQTAAFRHGLAALGLIRPASKGGVILNPSREVHWDIAEEDRIALLNPQHPVQSHREA